MEMKNLVSLLPFLPVQLVSNHFLKALCQSRDIAAGGLCHQKTWSSSCPGTTAPPCLPPAAPNPPSDPYAKSLWLKNHLHVQKAKGCLSLCKQLQGHFTDIWVRGWLLGKRLTPR